MSGVMKMVEYQSFSLRTRFELFSICIHRLTLFQVLKNQKNQTL